MAETIARATKQTEVQLARLGAERRGLERELGQLTRELGGVAALGHDGRMAGQLANLGERIEAGERRLAEIDSQMATLTKSQIDPDEAARALLAFDPIWETLTPREQTRIVQLLVARVGLSSGN